MSDERRRLDEADRGERDWRLWGPYLSERQWGTVREDYSEDGDAWDYFPHEASRSRAYRWGEDGLAGLCDAQQRLCLALGLWNGRDAILKERLFGLGGPQGNHGEDVKEIYYYLDATPTSSYLKMLYRYPQAEFPYTELIEVNGRRGRDDPEYELLDTGVLDGDRYFDVFVEYAKAAPDDVLMRVTAVNRGPEPATLHLLPQLWFRNTWSWGVDDRKPVIALRDGALRARHHALGEMWFAAAGEPELMLCDNETNAPRLFGLLRGDRTYKDAFHDAVVGGRDGALRQDGKGTKAAAWFIRVVPAGGETVLKLRLSRQRQTTAFVEFDEIFARRILEADAFYAALSGSALDAERRRVQRQAWAGMLWSKQFYYFDVREWLRGDPEHPAPPASRREGRNAGWTHLSNADVISMPDKWEYPWYAAWDLAFHCIPLARLDPAFAKQQLLLLTREWYMHPNGQLPAYEWSFDDVNPPVHAWASLRVFKIDRERSGQPDFAFLQKVFHKLLLNFTWWVNRKDVEGRNVFQGGFLGLDNIGVFDRSAELPTGGHILQADATSWMGMYCLNMMRIALELSRKNPVYEDIATKFFEHFLYIAEALTNLGGEGIDLWDEEDEFFYDLLHLPDGHTERLKVRSMVGLTPLFAVEVLEPEGLECVPDFRRRLRWFLEYRPDLARLVSRWQEKGRGERRLLSLLRGHRMKCLLRRALDETEFLSPHGIRALSRWHHDHPYRLRAGGAEYTVSYEPGESRSGMFGGNSNWRGPVWFPLNYLIIESIRRFHRYYGDDFKVEYPTGSGEYLTLSRIADELESRLVSLFLPDASGRIPALGAQTRMQDDPHFSKYPLFYEYFHGESGAGLGASHQTGWTGLVAELMHPVPRRS